MKHVVLVIVLLGATAAAAPRRGAVITVRVLTAKVMKAPRFIGPIAGDVSRGQHLAFEEARGDWYRVAAPAGWIHRTNLTEQKVVLSSRPGDASGSTASRDEIELAGRGFTPQVERQYRSAHPALDFRHVDAIERAQLDPAALEAFVVDGKLAVGGTR